MDEHDLFAAMHTQRAIRLFSTKSVPDNLIHRILDAAIRAPSASNRQPWTFLVITDRQLKQKIGIYYKQAWDMTFGSTRSQKYFPPNIRNSANFLSENMAKVPVLILACITHEGSPSTLLRGSSIYPAVQNLMLAARGLGLGTVITTLHKQFEPEIKSILGIPDLVETAALIPLGYPKDGVNFGVTRRIPVEEVTYGDRWGQKWVPHNLGFL